MRSSTSEVKKEKEIVYSISGFHFGTCFCSAHLCSLIVFNLSSRFRRVFESDEYQVW
jgi:hypothetical protein